VSLVFFDFDRTLTTRDTILPLGLFLYRAQSTKFRGVGRLLWAAIRLKCGTLSNHEFKEEFCRCLVQGETPEQIERVAHDFTTRHVARVFRRPLVRILHEHRQAGDEVYIVSSNFLFVLDPLRQQLDVSGIIATELEVVGGRYTGNLAGRACAGAEKLQRVVARFGHDRVRQAVAYGDSEDDRQLLEFVRTPVWV
jgi:phosphatidylglycerophosphatase C